MGIKRTLTVCVVPGLVALLVGILAPATAFASTPIVSVPPPNGAEDTTNLQAALNQCLTLGPGCTVQLSPGTYHTKQLVTYGFDGTFKGAGRAATTIEALPNLPTTGRDLTVQGECRPDPQTCPWPSLIMFVGGRIEVSDLSIRITAAPGAATEGWFINGQKITTLVDALRFMGMSAVDASVDRVSVSGLPDDSPNSFAAFAGLPFGFNVVNGIIYTGEFPRSQTPFDYFFTTGSFNVRNSSFSTMIDGVSQDGFVTSSRVVVGGSESTANHFDDLFTAIDLESSQSSTFDVSHNQVSGRLVGMWIIPWLPQFFTPNSLSQYLIHDNSFQATDPGSIGVFLRNVPTPWIQANVWNNTIQVEDPGAEGIRVANTTGAVIHNNTITGVGFDAIGVYRQAAMNTIVGNDLNGFTATGPGAIFLAPPTSLNNIVCSTTSDTVFDLGFANQLVGCNGTRGQSSTPAFRSDPTFSKAL